MRGMVVGEGGRSSGVLLYSIYKIQFDFAQYGERFACCLARVLSIVPYATCRFAMEVPGSTTMSFKNNRKRSYMSGVHTMITENLREKMVCTVFQ